MTHRYVIRDENGNERGGGKEYRTYLAAKRAALKARRDYGYAIKELRVYYWLPEYGEWEHVTNF